MGQSCLHPTSVNTHHIKLVLMYVCTYYVYVLNFLGNCISKCFLFLQKNIFGISIKENFSLYSIFTKFWDIYLQHWKYFLWYSYKRPTGFYKIKITIKWSHKDTVKDSGKLWSLFLNELHRKAKKGTPRVWLTRERVSFVRTFCWRVCLSMQMFEFILKKFR